MGSAFVLLGVLLLLVLWIVSIYNSLVHLRNYVDNAWAQIDVQLKRRHDLIPNLIETVKGYMVHEREVLTTITEARANAMKASTVNEKIEAETKLTSALQGLRVAVENYPDLKASQNFLDLQQELSDIEDQIQMARRYYNGTVRENNVLVESFPSNFVARLGGFGKGDFFELEDEGERKTPQVKFN